MKSKRTILKVLLAMTAAICLLFSVAACGKTPSGEPSAQPSATITAPTEEPTTNPTAKPTTPTAKPTTPTEEPTTNPTAPSVQPTEEPTTEPTPADPFSGIAFSNKNVTYDGTEQSLAVSGLPEGATVIYDGNGQILPGEYKVKATVFIGEASKEYTANLRIRKARVTVTADNKEKDIYDLNPAFTYTVSGLAATDAWETDGALNTALFSGEVEFTTDCEQYSPLGVYDIRVFGVTSEIYDVRFKSATLTVKTYTTDLVKGGFQLNGDYDTVYDGEQVNWMGINFFTMFNACWDVNRGAVNESGVQGVYDALETLASYNCKAIRFFPMCYYPFQQGGWFNNRQEFIYTWHRIINKAASLNIGLVPSICFNTGIMQNGLKEIYGADWDKHDIDWGELASAVTEGKSHPCLDILWDYTDTFVSEFAEHPAIMIWEWSNEYNLVVGVGDNQTFNTENTQIVREAWAERVYNLDRYHRLIGTGDSVLRGTQYQIWKYDRNAGQDTEEEHQKVLAYLNGGKFSAISAHDYFSSTYGRIYEVIPSGKTELLDQFFNDREAYDAIVAQYPASTDKEWQMAPYFGRTTMKELFQMQVDEARTLQMGMYVGETGFASSDNRTWTMEELDMFLSAYEEAMRASKMPLALFWNYDYVSDPIEGDTTDHGTGTEYSWNERWEKGERYLQMIKRYNSAKE